MHRRFAEGRRLAADKAHKRLTGADRLTRRDENALDADPDATYLLGQLRRTYARRLELTQRAAGATPA